jgi:hypothetical protein
LLQYGSGLRYSGIGQCGMVVLKRVVLVVYRVIEGYLDGTAKHERWFEGGRPIAYIERCFGIGGFPLLLSLLVLLYSKASHNFQINLNLCHVLISSIQTSSAFSFVF